MKILNEVAIWFVTASILMDCYNNTLTYGDLVIRIFLIGLNAVCCAIWDEG